MRQAQCRHILTHRYSIQISQQRTLMKTTSCYLVVQSSERQVAGAFEQNESGVVWPFLARQLVVPMVEHGLVYG